MKYRYEFILRGKNKTLTTIIGDLLDSERVEEELMKEHNLSEKDILVAIRGIVKDGKLFCLPCKENQLKKQREIELGVCESCMERMERSQAS